MIIVYEDVGGAHSSCIAANLHINKLPYDRIPTSDELMALPTFDKITKSQYGRLIHIGDDEFGNQIYTISRQRKPELVIPAITDMFNILNPDSSDLLVVCTQPKVNIWMKIGGGSSRRLNLVAFGRPIVIYGCKKAYYSIVDLVKTVRNQAAKNKFNKKQ
jgi:hypothetical protein